MRFPRTNTPVSEFDSKLSRTTSMNELSQVNLSVSDMPDLRFYSTFNDFADISLSSSAHESFSIPKLGKYLKSDIDPDFATTLYSLYLSHCRALVEALRFMHIKKFVTVMGSFVGGLTAPIQKLLHEEDVINWIIHSDWVMYKEMAQMLSPLGLQEIPMQVATGLRSLSQHLPQHLNNTLGNYDRMLQAKLKPAQQFCNLLDRLIRANETGVNASKILSNPVETRKMREDWTRFVNPQSIVQREVPCGSLEAERILSEDVVQLLSIDDYNSELFDLNVKAEDGKPENSSNIFAFTKLGGSSTESQDMGYSKSEMIVLKWAQYLTNLPSLFPNTPARLFLLCLSALLTGALREISMNGGEGFGAWWVVRCWIDEWMGWSAEMGGFLSVNLDDPPGALRSHHAEAERAAARKRDDLGFGALEDPALGPGSTRLMFPEREGSDKENVAYFDKTTKDDIEGLLQSNAGSNDIDDKEGEDLDVPKVDESNAHSPDRPPLTLASPSSHDTKKNGGGGTGNEDHRRLSFEGLDDMSALTTTELGEAVSSEDGTQTGGGKIHATPHKSELHLHGHHHHESPTSSTLHHRHKEGGVTQV